MTFISFSSLENLERRDLFLGLRHETAVGGCSDLWAEACQDGAGMGLGLLHGLHTIHCTTAVSRWATRSCAATAFGKFQAWRT